MSEFIRAVLPDVDGLFYAELYDDPPDLLPLPEEEPLIARQAKRRNEFVTARHCARLAMEELGVPPSPILKGEKGEPQWPSGVASAASPTHGYRGAVVGRASAVRSVWASTPNPMTLPDKVLEAVSLPVERHEISALPGAALGPNPVLRQGGDLQGVVPAHRTLVGFRGCPHHLRGRSGGDRRTLRLPHPDRPGRTLRSAADRTRRPLVGGRRFRTDGDRAVTRPVPPPGIVVVDKPAGMTSHDVVGRCRRIFGTLVTPAPWIRMATGVLVIGIERATKILGLLTATSKSYAATIHPTGSHHHHRGRRR